ncbi:uncharacterized protein METZ01_LOCUS296050, partial [marine metagenome]
PPLATHFMSYLLDRSKKIMVYPCPIPTQFST